MLRKYVQQFDGRKYCESVEERAEENMVLKRRK
jgi:hypothetical protein